ncbi:hypothetical protein EPUL_005350, partial [Erysiphe pulchra]
MSVPCTSGKRKQESSYQNLRSQKLDEERISKLTPAFCDELDRINRQHRNHNKPSKPQPQIHPPITQEHLEHITQIARNGGFDLTDLRDHPEPGQDVMELSPTNEGSASRLRPTETTTTRSKNTGPRNSSFRSTLIENGVYPSNYRFPATGKHASSPGNIQDLTEIAIRRRSSLSTEKFTDADFVVFEDFSEDLIAEKDVVDHIIPIIDGTYDIKGYSCCNKPFNNLKLLAPDLCHGSDPEKADSTVRKDLADMIPPSNNKQMPLAPNFFLEVKSGKGNPDVADLQALHTGALGERGILALRVWRREGLGLDNKAHTITVTYAKKYNRRIDLENVSDDDIIGYIRFKCGQYKREEWFDEDLWETFAYDFENFNLEHWKKAEKGALQSLRKTLRSAGVNVQKDEVNVWDALAYMVNSKIFPPWTEDQIKKTLKDKSFKFTSGKILWLLENDYGHEGPEIKPKLITVHSDDTRKEESLKAPVTQESTAITLQSHHQQSNNLVDIGRQSGNLSKIYTEDMKYSGENDNFAYKLMIFNDNCSRAGVAPENFTKVFPTMLKGLAFDFYYANISSIPKTFDDVCKLFQDYFEGEEYKRGVLEKWNNVNLQSTTKQFSNKSTIECLQLM